MRAMRFGSPSASEFLSPFISDTSPKCLDREGLGIHHTGARQQPQITGGAGEGGLQKNFFRSFGPQFGLKIWRGGGRGGRAERPLMIAL